MPKHMPRKRFWRVRSALLPAVFAAGVAMIAFSNPADAAQFTVYKSAWCGCCTNWTDQLKANGHTVTIKDVDNLEGIKKLAGIPPDLQACHTASVDGYLVEGHVPIKEIDRLLAERPKARGLAVPGMPGGALGMEGSEPERYDVILFKVDGTTSVYARY